MTNVNDKRAVRAYMPEVDSHVNRVGKIFFKGVHGKRKALPEFYGNRVLRASNLPLCWLNCTGSVTTCGYEAMNMRFYRKHLYGIFDTDVL